MIQDIVRVEVMVSQIIIRKLVLDQYERWNEFVYANPYGTVFHLTHWKEAVEKAFGHRAHYVYAEKDGKIEGVFPLIQVKSLLFGNIISSVPFAAYGGPLAVQSEVLGRLLDYGKKLTADLQGDYLDLKFSNEQFTGLPQSDLHVTFIKEISADHDENLKAIPRKQRAMVRKGIKSGLVAHFSNDYLDDFFKIYAENVQRMGTPVYSKKWFETLLDVFGERANLLVIEHDNQIISGVLSFYYKDTVLPYYAASMVEHRSLAPNDFQYWVLMQHAVAKGCRYFDFGRSKKGTGPYNFKKNWGFEPQPLHYQYYLNRLQELPELNPMNPKYRMKIEAWKRLPAVVARVLGPMIVKNIP